MAAPDARAKRGKDPERLLAEQAASLGDTFPFLERKNSPFLEGTPKMLDQMVREIQRADEFGPYH